MKITWSVAYSDLVLFGSIGSSRLRHGVSTDSTTSLWLGRDKFFFFPLYLNIFCVLERDHYQKGKTYEKTKNLLERDQYQKEKEKKDTLI